MRLNKFIALHTEYSRRKADELIKAGKVEINGKTTTDLSTQITENEEVKISGKIICSKTEKIYIALHKPAGYICTRSDEKGRKTVMDLVPQKANLKPVGRLDKETEGLLLLSNDGDFINKFTHPKFECEKEYYAEVEGTLATEKKHKLEKGIILEGKKTAAAKIRIIKELKNTTILTITIHEGRKRQIRKMFAQVHHPVKYLRRLRIGKIKLKNLAKSKHRKLSNSEINAH